MISTVGKIEFYDGNIWYMHYIDLYIRKIYDNVFISLLVIKNKYLSKQLFH